MGITRSDLFSEAHNSLTGQLKALGHPARWAMVMHLLDQEGCVNADFVTLTGLAQATVSRHLAVLVGAGLVACDCNGGRAAYCVQPAAWQALEAAFCPAVQRAARTSITCSSDTPCCTPS